MCTYYFIILRILRNEFYKKILKDRKAKTNKQTPEATYLNPILKQKYGPHLSILSIGSSVLSGSTDQSCFFLFLFWSYSHYSQRLVFHGLFL